MARRIFQHSNKQSNQTPWLESEGANYTDLLSDRRLSAKLVPTLADRGCRVVSATNPPQSEYFNTQTIPKYILLHNQWLCYCSPFVQQAKVAAVPGT
jgi:hypothetical protein